MIGSLGIFSDEFLIGEQRNYPYPIGFVWGGVIWRESDVIRLPDKK